MTNLLQFTKNTRNPARSKRFSRVSYKVQSGRHVSQKHAVEYVWDSYEHSPQSKRANSLQLLHCYKINRLAPEFYI
jgi:hypothetical protein